jgi:transcriptional regulator GlxA family with amidase domain
MSWLSSGELVRICAVSRKKRAAPLGSIRTNAPSRAPRNRRSDRGAKLGARLGDRLDRHTDLALTVERTLDEVPSADILIIPGGPGERLLLKDENVLEWFGRSMRPRSGRSRSSLLLGAAGLLKGLVATTHWNATAMLESFGAKYREKRVIPQGKIVTSAGVSSGIDMALWLVVGKIAERSQWRN